MNGHPFMGNLGGVRTFEPIPNNPANGGSGYFRRNVNGGRTVRANYSSRRPVDYTAMPGVPDTEPGGNPTIAPKGMMFQQDGRLVPIPPGYFGAAPDAETSLMKFFLIGLFGGALVGSLFGAVLSSGRRVRNGAIGAGLGAAAGAVTSILIVKGVSLAKK